MIRLFENNPVAVGLASALAVLIVVSLLLGVAWSLPPSVPKDDAETGESDLGLDVPELAANEPMERYAVITERPLFNADRQPYVPSGEGEEGAEGEEELAEEEVEAPELELAGVIITPAIRMVTLRQKEGGESLIAFEGQPLEGNFGTWQVSDIEPRTVTLTSDGGGELSLELQVHDIAMAPPPKPQQDAGESESEPGAQQAAQRDSERPLTRAEEIRQRIAERREELRRAAEAEQEGEDEPEQPRDYQSAIQQMIRGGNKQDKDDNEQ